MSNTQKRLALASAVSTGTFEDFTNMPLNGIGIPIIRGPLGWTDRLAMKCYYPLLKAFGPVGVLRNNHNHVFTEGENAAVEEFVMHRTWGQTVGFLVRPAGLMPFDMRCLQSYVNRSEPDVEAANSAAVFVCPEHAPPKLRAASNNESDIGREVDYYGIQMS
jgi:hypothetical protein